MYLEQLTFIPFVRPARTYHQENLKIIIFEYLMSYVPLSSTEKEESIQEQVVKHRNPIYPSLKYPQPKPIHTLQSEITSSLLFQQLIYFNWFYSIIEIYLYAGSQIFRFIYFDHEYGVPVRTIIGIPFIFLEIFRLQNGNYGNVKESFPEMFAFFMITILTISAQLILISGLVPNSPMEWSVLFYGIIFHMLQFIVCLFKMGKLTQSQKALFLWRSPSSKMQ